MRHFTAQGIEKNSDYQGRGVESFRHCGGSSIESWYAVNKDNCAAGTTVATTLDTLVAVPFIAPARGGVLDRIGVNCAAGNSAGREIRIGLYNNVSDQRLFYPNSLLVDSGALSVATTGVKSATISQTLNPGELYWAAYVTNHSTPTFRSFALSTTANLLGADSSLTTAIQRGYTYAYTYAALPATFTAAQAAVQSTTLHPAIYIRFSA